MHVVQALAALSVGGSELVAAETTEYLISKGHRVTVLAAPGPLSARVEAAGAATLPWPVNRKRLSTLRYVGRLRAWLDREQPDLIHVHSRLPALICWLALRGLPASRRPALVTSVHGHYSVSRYSALMTQGDAVIAVSDAIRDYALHNYKVDPGRVRVIHGGVDSASFPFGFSPSESWREAACSEFPELRGRRWLCLPGRLSRYKGHADFINLVAALLPDFPDIQGVIVGPGREGSRYRDELEGLAIAGHIQDRITFAGVREDISEWMAASEVVFNLCSDPPEAFGRTVLEALCLGRPVVAWNHGGVKEILARMYPFGAVPPGNIGALKAQTETFLRMAPPVEHQDAFPLTESLAKTLDLYRDVLSARNDTGAGS